MSINCEVVVVQKRDEDDGTLAWISFKDGTWTLGGGAKTQNCAGVQLTSSRTGTWTWSWRSSGGPRDFNTS